MILEVFIIFLVICFVLIFLGFYTDIKVIALIGFVGLFLLGLSLQSSNLVVQSGLNVSVTQVLYNYDVVNDTFTLWLGRWLAFAGALGFILTIISNKKSDVKK